MKLLENNDNVKDLVDGLNFKQKVDRELDLIIDALEEIGNKLSLYINPTQDDRVVEEETYDF